MPDAGGSSGTSAMAPPLEPAAGTPNPKLLLGKYELGRLLGCGAFAKVYHARHALTGQGVALKVLSKSRIVRSGLSGNVRREIVAMKRIHHPHVLRLIDVMASRSKIYLVLELARGGEVFSRLSARGRLTEDTARMLFRQLLSAVAFCHSRGVFHRDLKPENLLLDEAGRLKVSDFGLSALSPSPFPQGPAVFNTLCGTPAYVAPEVLRRRPYDAAKVDLWSCGVILFVLSSGYLPFNDPNLMELYRKIYRADFRFPKWTSPELRRLISSLLDADPSRRITVDGIVHDPWFRYGLNQHQIDSMMYSRAEIEERISRIERDEEERDLNAFDIISLSNGFDLSNLFVSEMIGRERFVSAGTVWKVLERVEEVGKREGFSVRKRKGKEGRGGAVIEGKTGGSIAWVEVYRLNRDWVLVELEQGEEENGGGGKGEGYFWKEKLGPALRGPGCGSEPSSPVSVLRPEPSGSGSTDSDGFESDAESNLRV